MEPQSLMILMVHGNQLLVSHQSKKDNDHCMQEDEHRCCRTNYVARK